jgi:hypothetical protein
VVLVLLIGLAERKDSEMWNDQVVRCKHSDPTPKLVIQHVERSKSERQLCMVRIVIKSQSDKSCQDMTIVNDDSKEIIYIDL